MRYHGSKTALTAFVGMLVVAGSAYPSEESSFLVGDWSGTSICVNKEKFPACNDENVVYHFKVANKKDTFDVAADKIVNGEPQNMGDLEFRYDADKHTLYSEFSNGRVHISIEFDVKGDVMSGHMFNLPDRTIVRDINLKKMP